MRHINYKRKEGFYESLKELTGFDINSDTDINGLLRGLSDVSILSTIPVYLILNGPEEVSKDYQDNSESYVNVVYNSRHGLRNPVHYITTNLLTLLREDRLEDLKFISDEDPQHHEPWEINQIDNNSDV